MVSITEIDDYLEHHGVRGMKWGVLRERAAAGNGRATRKLAKADLAWKNELNSTKGFIKINNQMATHMNGPKGSLAKLNNSPAFKGKDVNPGKPLHSKYMAEFAKVNNAAFMQSLKEIYPESPSGNYTTKVDLKAGTVEVVPTQIKHGFEDGRFIFSIKVDKNGFIEILPPEDSLQHSEMVIDVGAIVIEELLSGN